MDRQLTADEYPNMASTNLARANAWQQDADNLARKAQRAGSPVRRAELARKALAAGMMAARLRAGI